MGKGRTEGEPEAELNPRKRMWCKDPGPGAFSREAESSLCSWAMLLGAVCVPRASQLLHTEMPWSRKEGWQLQARIASLPAHLSPNHLNCIGAICSKPSLFST